MRRARLAIAFFFFADGLLLGSWATRIPAVQRQADVTTTQLGLALFAASLGALVAMPLAGWIGARVGSRRVTTVALVGGAGSLVVVSLAGDLAALAVGLFGFGAGFGAINVAANAQGLALEARYGRAILSTFHAAFSGGALAGAAGGALTAAFGVGPQPHFGALALAVAVGGVAGSRWLLPPNSNAEPSDRTLVRPPRSVLVLGAAAFLTLLAEGAAVDWSAVYLSDSVGASAGAAALGYTAFSLAMVVSRLCGDRINERAGPVTLVRAGGLIAASGLAVALAGGSTALALVGLSSMGAGLGVIVPVLFRAAGTAPGLAAGSGVAVVSSIGWLGFLAGPPAIGFAAGTFGLRNALWLVVAAAAGLALIARSVEPRPRSAFRGLLLEPRAVLSDLDGVLVDSGAQVERSWRAFAERHGLDADQVLAHAHGRRAIDLVRLVAPHLDAEAEVGLLEQEEIASAPGLRALPGARELIESVPACRFAIVTSGSRALALARLRAAGLPVPDVLVTAEHVEHGKPDPAGYLSAALLLGVEPAHSVVLEDAPAGVEAGLAAGMTVIAVSTTHDESALRRAHGLVTDLRALLPG